MKKIIIVLGLALTLISTVSPINAAQVQKGDILLFGNPAVGPDDPGYTDQACIFFSQAAMRDSGVYSPFWGDISTWDDTDFPMGKRYFWGHIEIATKDGFEPACMKTEWGETATMLILRPTELLKAKVNMEECLIGYQDILDIHNEDIRIGYSQPIFGAWVKWLLWGKEKNEEGKSNIEWFDQPDLFWKWNEIYGIDLDFLNAPKFMQYSPHLLDEDYTDVSSPKFIEKDVNCSSIVGLSLARGCYAKFPIEVRKFFLNNTVAMAAIDSVAPANLAWWLHKHGFVEIIFLSE